MADSTTPTPEPTAVEKKVLGMTLGDVMKIVLGLLVGGMLTAFGFWLNSSSPHLNVVVPTPVQFQGDKSKFSILSFSVTNDGSKAAANVVCFFKTKGAKAADIKATPEILNPITTIKDETVTIKIASLNSSERLNVIAHVPDVLPEKLNITVRGDGVNGEENPQAPLNREVGNMLIGAILTLGLIAIFRIAQSGRKETAVVQALLSQWGETDDKKGI